MESQHGRTEKDALPPWYDRRAAWSKDTDFWWRLGSKRMRLTVETLALVLALVVAVAWFGAPYLVRDYINRGLADLPDYNGRVERVRLHPWNASLDVYEVHLDKRAGEIPVHFFYAPSWHIALQWSQIFHGVTRASVTVLDPQINLVTGPNADESQLSISMVWMDAVKAMIPWRVNQVRLHRGEVHFLDFQADPRVDLAVNQLEITAENMSNSEGLKVPLPATIKISARPLGTGIFAMDMGINFDEQYATFTQTVRMEHVPAIGANSALQKYLKVRVSGGEIGVYSELASDKGVYHGYVKPFFYRLEFAPKPSDEGNPGAIWSGILNTAKGLFENDQHAIATQSQVSGRVDRPRVDAVSVITGALWNAYIEALRPGFDPTHAPAKPTDTVTTPSSATTEQETNQPSPAEKK